MFENPLTETQYFYTDVDLAGDQLEARTLTPSRFLPEYVAGQRLLVADRL